MATTLAMHHMTASGGGSHNWPGEIAVILVFVGVIWLIGWLRKQRNTPRFEALAQRYGGIYAAKAQARLETFPGTDWKPVGNPFEVEDYLTGYYRQRRFYCFGWKYIQNSPADGDVDSTSVNMSVYAVELPGVLRSLLRAQALRCAQDVRPERRADRIPGVRRALHRARAGTPGRRAGPARPAVAVPARRPAQQGPPAVVHGGPAGLRLPRPLLARGSRTRAGVPGPGGRAAGPPAYAGSGHVRWEDVLPVPA